MENNQLSDAMTSMIVCYSASANGDFRNIELKITIDRPYIEVDKHSLKK